MLKPSRTHPLCHLGAFLLLLLLPGPPVLGMLSSHAAPPGQRSSADTPAPQCSGPSQPMISGRILWSWSLMSDPTPRRAIAVSSLFPAAKKPAKLPGCGGSSKRRAGTGRNVTLIRCRGALRVFRALAGLVVGWSFLLSAQTWLQLGDLGWVGRGPASPRWVTSLLPRLRRSWAGERRLLQLLTGEDGERGELCAQFPPSLLLRDLSRHLLPR